MGHQSSPFVAQMVYSQASHLIQPNQPFPPSPPPKKTYCCSAGNEGTTPINAIQLVVSSKITKARVRYHRTSKKTTPPPPTPSPTPPPHSSGEKTTKNKTSSLEVCARRNAELSGLACQSKRSSWGTKLQAELFLPTESGRPRVLWAGTLTGPFGCVLFWMVPLLGCSF